MKKKYTCDVYKNNIFGERCWIGTISYNTNEELKRELHDVEKMFNNATFETITR